MGLRLLLGFVASATLLACAQQPPSSSNGEASGPDPTVPDAGRIICQANGTTSVLTPEIAVQPDGVHVRIESLLDEPASVNGLGVDVEPGTSTWTLGTPPGTVDIACWPFSQHRGKEPHTTPVRIIDEDGVYVSSELECLGGTSWGSTWDFIADAKGSDEDPIVIARRHLRGLVPSDKLEVVGYPDERDPRGVRVVRDGRTIAVVGLQSAQSGGLLVSGGTGCSDDGVLVGG